MFRIRLYSPEIVQLKNLRTHLKAAHEGVRFSCSVCEKKFRSKQAVRRHAKKCSLKIEKRAVRTGNNPACFDRKQGKRGDQVHGEAEYIS